MGEHPESLGPYVIRGRIGSGGMGVVYLGWDGRLNRHVAVKTLWPELARNPENRARFLREARAAAALSHPNLTQIHDIGEEDGQAWFAMEYLKGRAVDDLLTARGRFSPREAVALIRQAATGLKAAADAGIIHRDIKPANLVVLGDGTLKVTDFGLAKEAVADASLTVSGQLIGTPYYVSPEQASGGTADVRSDIYSLGATLFEMLTGRPPCQGPTPVSVIVKHVNEPAPDPQVINGAVPPALARLIQRMLAKDPAQRPQGYGVLLAELTQVEARLESGAAAGDRPSGAPLAPGAGTGARPGLHASHAATVPQAGRQRKGAAAPAATVPLTAVEPRRRSSVWAAVGLALAALAGAWYLLEHGSPVQSRPLQAVSPAGTDTAAPAAGSGPEAGQDGSTGAAWGEERTASRRAGRPGGLLDRLRGAPAALDFVEKHREITADGRLRIWGEVVNSGDRLAGGSRVRILLTDEGGRRVDGTETPVLPHRLGPGETGHFEAHFPDPGRTVHISLELNWVS